MRTIHILIYEKKYHKLMRDVYCHCGYSIPLTFGKIVGGGANAKSDILTWFYTMGHSLHQF